MIISGNSKVFRWVKKQDSVTYSIWFTIYQLRWYYDSDSKVSAGSMEMTLT